MSDRGNAVSKNENALGVLVEDKFATVPRRIDDADGVMCLKDWPATFVHVKSLRRPILEAFISVASGVSAISLTDSD